MLKIALIQEFVAKVNGTSIQYFLNVFLTLVYSFMIINCHLIIRPTITNDNIENAFSDLSR